MITIATLLWKANNASHSFSSMYDELWVRKLYHGFRRNLTHPFRFVCYVDTIRFFKEQIEQRLIANRYPSYADCIQPYELDEPMILVGLDTIVCGNIDHMAALIEQPGHLLLPRDPSDYNQACNGVALVSGGFGHVALMHDKQNDMVWVRKFCTGLIDDRFPNQVMSYKQSFKQHRQKDARIVFFHGLEKPHELPDEPLVKEHWRIS